MKSMKILTANNYIFSFMLSCLMFGFMAIGIASASTVDTRSGDWVKKDYSINGNWSVEQRGDQQVIAFDKKFKTKNGPDLKVFLSLKSIDAANGKNATDGSVLVAVLKKNKGSQEYVLPEGIDVNDYESLLIHCEKYSVLWGGTNL